MITALPNFILISPELFLLGMICIVLLVDLFLKQKRQRFTYLLTQITLIGAFFLTLSLYTYSDTVDFYGLFIHYQIAVLLKLTILVTSGLVFALSRDYLIAHDIPQGEFYLLGLFSILGMMVSVSANHFLSLYLGLELMSLPLYAMVALYRNSEKAIEAAIKYFVLGVIFSAMLLYGLSMLYGVTHALEMSKVSQVIITLNQSKPPLILILGLVFVLVGLAFKLGLAPFHMWIPDVYEGAATPITLFITVAPKIATFGIIYRILVNTFPSLNVQWQEILIVMAVLSIVVGNMGAIIQNNLKRMFAYSTIAHGGYMILGLCAASPEGFAASMYYAIVYGVMSLVGFGLLAVMSNRGMEVEEITDLKGLNAHNPWLAFIMLLALFSMAGIPPTVGFFAKLGVLHALITASFNLVWLACFAIVFAVIGSYYYLRVIKVMYFDEPKIQEPVVITTRGKVSISFAGLAILFLGIFPSSLIDVARIAMMGR